MLYELPESHHPGLFQSSQATVLTLLASPELRRPPGKQSETSWTQNCKITKIIKITRNGGIHTGIGPRYLSSHEFSWHFCDTRLVEGYLLAVRFPAPYPGRGQKSPEKSKKTPQILFRRVLVINHRFPVSELLFEH